MNKSNKNKADQYNNLEVLFPKIAKEWDYSKNKKTPKDYTRGSNYKAGWICSSDPEHKWNATIQSRTIEKIKATGCPYCSNRKVDKNNSLMFKFPEIAKEWRPFKNGDKTSENVVFGSCYKAWWQCPKYSDHEWQMRVVDRIPPYDQSCPYCENRRVDKYNCLATLYPNLAKEWHPTKNGNKMPSDFVCGSHEKIWWVCKKNKDHEWEAKIDDRAGVHKSNCPYCSGNKADEDNNLLILYPKLSLEWHSIKNENNKPEDFLLGSHYKAWWECEFKHEWQATIKDRAGPNPTNCPYCSNKKVCDDNCLLTVFPEIAAEWHPKKNEDKTPRDFVYGSHHKAWWSCKEHPEHEWVAPIGNRTGNAKEGCPFCFKNISKMETKWLDILNIPIDCRNIYIKLPNGKKYKPDAYIKEENTVYEFNGDFWHGNPKKFNPEEINCKNGLSFGELYRATLKKEEELKKYGYIVISMWESDFKEYLKRLQ